MVIKAIKTVFIYVLLLSFAGTHTFAATLDGGPPPFGSSAQEIRNDDILEKAELYKRATIRSNTITVPVSNNALVITSTNVPVTTLSEGISVDFVAIANNSSSPANTIALDSTPVTAFTNVDGSSFLGGEIVSGRQYHARYYTASNQWRLGTSLPGTAITNAPAGNIVSTNSQAAVNELDTKKASLALSNVFTNAQIFNGAATFNAAVTANPANANISLAPSGTGTITINPATVGLIDNVNVGATIAGTGRFSTLSATGAVTLSPANVAVVISPSGTGTVAISPVGALTINPTAASTINNISIGVTTPAAGKFTILTATNLIDSTTAPTVSGFCTSPSVPANNGTWAFTINVGTACAASTGTITLPAATTGWICDLHDVTTPTTNIVEMTGGTTTTVTVQNYVRTTGIAGNFTTSDVLRVKCSAY